MGFLPQSKKKSMFVAMCLRLLILLSAACQGLRIRPAKALSALTPSRLAPAIYAATVIVHAEAAHATQLDFALTGDFVTSEASSLGTSALSAVNDTPLLTMFFLLCACINLICWPTIRAFLVTNFNLQSMHITNKLVRLATAQYATASTMTSLVRGLHSSESVLGGLDDAQLFVCFGSLFALGIAIATGGRIGSRR